MKSSNTYRRFAALIFLLVYIFIAMPVQVWHHHISVKEKPAAVKVSKATISVQSEDCKICQHTYAVYTADENRYDEFIIELLDDNSSFLNTCFPDPCLEKATNKGPPSIS